MYTTNWLRENVNTNVDLALESQTLRASRSYRTRVIDVIQKHNIMEIRIDRSRKRTGCTLCIGNFELCVTDSKDAISDIEIRSTDPDSCEFQFLGIFTKTKTFPLVTAIDHIRFMKRREQEKRKEGGTSSRS